ncbi:hypothetical protein BKI52_28780 [marine bacterium AO1-C]|nr:hypothetical protein BKI52_28780 [marine bacterium AO1-C]
MKISQMLSSDLMFTNINTQPDKHPIFFYKGGINNDVVAKMKNLIDTKLKTTHQIHYKTRSILLELAQNIMSYSVEYNALDGEERVGLLALDETKDTFVFLTGNLINTQNQATLLAHAADINARDQKGLADLKLSLIKDNLMQKTKRAGIGLVQVAILSENGYQLKIKSINAQYAYLTIAVTIFKNS